MSRIKPLKNIVTKLREKRDVRRPLRKLVNKARDLGEHHSERHRPSGFGFALADSIDYLDQERWDAITANHSLFLSPRYLRVLEEAGPKNVRQRYALVFRGKNAVAAVSAQCVTVSLERVHKSPNERHPNRSNEIAKRDEDSRKFTSPLSVSNRECLFVETCFHGECTASLLPKAKTQKRSGPLWLKRSID